jgi:SAM-dependent methyltransferase
MMSVKPPSWDQRYANEAYLFGEAPNAFLASQAFRLTAGDTALALADGEGRNGVWLAEQGLDVISVDSSAVAQAKAHALAEKKGVRLRLELADLETWIFPTAAIDVVVGIFIQFAGPELRMRLFEGMKTALKPGGLILLEGYRPEQLVYRTGGPSIVENLYTESLLREAFSDFEILELNSYDAEINEGDGHKGMSALIDLIAKKPE